MNSLVIVILVIAVIFVFFISLYNSLVAKQNQVKSVEAGIDAQLKRRYDLIPNLVATAKEYMVHEKSLLENITALRESARSASTNEEKFELNNKISGLLNGLRVSVENYPDLKANQNLLHIQSTLNEVEEQISAARRAYNSAVEIYNNAIQMFPSNIVASMFGFHKDVFFDIPENEAAAPNVGDLFKK
ncbi:LemA family protein [Campylobacter concisus]|jgi:lemA protein|uniref:LemA family protein n=1 Tax=Campylobacter concisus TaxID=199 RepID=UPI000CD85BC4|nr:LemA family protein [Campylobacter concisus]